MLREISQANLDLGFFQGTKIVYGVYTRGSVDYIFVATDAPSRHRSGVTFFYRASPLFLMGLIQHYRPNFVSFQLEIG